MNLSDNDLKMFKASLQSGMGFTKSCNLIMKSVLDMSDYAHKEPAFNEFCEEAIVTHAAKMISLGIKALMADNAKNFVNQNIQLTRLVSKLTLWEDFCTKKDLDDKKLLKAVFLLKYPEEVATGCGLTMEDLYDYVIKNPNVNTYLTEINFLG